MVFRPPSTGRRFLLVRPRGVSRRHLSTVDRESSSEGAIFGRCCLKIAQRSHKGRRRWLYPKFCVNSPTGRAHLKIIRGGSGPVRRRLACNITPAGRDVKGGAAVGVSNCAVKGNQKEKKELKYQRDENDTWLSQDQTCYRLLQRQILQPEDFPVFSENTSFAALMWECNGANQH